MTLADLYRVTTINTRVQVFSKQSLNSWVYDGFLYDIPVKLLNYHIILISAYEENCLLITIA